DGRHDHWPGPVPPVTTTLSPSRLAPNTNPPACPRHGNVAEPLPSAGPRAITAACPSAPVCRISIWYSRVNPGTAGGSGNSLRPPGHASAPVTTVTAGGSAISRSSVIFSGTITSDPLDPFARESPAQSPLRVTDRLSAATVAFKFLTPATGPPGAA